MMKKSVLLFAVLLVILASAGPALAYYAPVVLYVDTAYVGTEDGSAERPYNTEAEADAVGQTKPDGAVIMVKDANGVYQYDHFVDPVTPGQTGLPLAGPVLYILLAVLSLILIAAGWMLKRRSQAHSH